MPICVAVKRHPVDALLDGEVAESIQLVLISLVLGLVVTGGRGVAADGVHLEVAEGGQEGMLSSFAELAEICFLSAFLSNILPLDLC